MFRQFNFDFVYFQAINTRQENYTAFFLVVVTERSLYLQYCKRCRVPLVKHSSNYDLRISLSPLKKLLLISNIEPAVTLTVELTVAPRLLLSVQCYSANVIC